MPFGDRSWRVSLEGKPPAMPYLIMFGLFCFVALVASCML